MLGLWGRSDGPHPRSGQLWEPEPEFCFARGASEPPKGEVDAQASRTGWRLGWISGNVFKSWRSAGFDVRPGLWIPVRVR